MKKVLRPVLTSLILYMYGTRNRRLKRYVLSLVKRVGGREEQSDILRKVFLTHHGVEIGAYTHGGCFNVGQYDRETRIGRYCSIARTSRAMNRNHPMEYKSMHAFFFNPRLGYCKTDNVEYVPLDIGSDVWIGHNAIIMPNVTSIGDGAVVGAGAVVNKDVPPYGVVVGNPGRVVRFRFSEDRIQELLAEKWWEKEIEDLKGNIDDFQVYASSLGDESE